MNKLNLSNYNLHSTLLGGQSFSWDLKDGAYYGFTQDKIVKILSQKGYIFWQTYPQSNDENFIKNYLNLDVDYEYIIQNFPKDTHLEKAINKHSGLRILNQDFEQTLLSFILSSAKNIKAIRSSIRDLNKKYGQKIIVDNKVFYLFPKTEILAGLSIAELKNSSIGFRANYLKSSAQKLIENKDKINSLKTENEYRDFLTSFNGVGNKIADCTMVFSLKIQDITPLDVWGIRILTDLYGLENNLKYEQMQSWVKDYFKGYGAWAGQFLFEDIRGFKP